MFTANDLITALSRTKPTAKVKVVALDGSHVLMSPAQASALAANSTDWEGFGRKRSISSIRRVNHQARKPDPVADLNCWRVSRAAVLPPPPEYFIGMRTCRA